MKTAQLIFTAKRKKVNLFTIPKFMSIFRTLHNSFIINVDVRLYLPIYLQTHKQVSGDKGLVVSNPSLLSLLC